jgi:putative endonuclease
MKLGKYQHSKTGNFYNVIAIAKHSETLEEFVVYEALYKNPRSKFWIRPKKMFLEKVVLNGKRVSRFKFIDEQKPEKEGKFYVYILRTSGNTLYTGQTNNLDRRMKEHKSKNSQSAKYTRNFDSFKLVYSEIHKTRKSAMTREALIKTWPKIKKEELIKTTCVKV